MNFAMRLCPSLPILVVAALTAASVTAQPLGVTLRTIEARVARADYVVIATIEKVAPELLDAKIGSPLGGPFKYTLTLKIVEALKGELKGTADDLRAIHGWRADDRYEEWSNAGTTLLCFLGAAPTTGGRRNWDFMPFGKLVPAEVRAGGRSDYPPLFSMDFTLVKDEAEMLNRARAHAKAWPGMQTTDMIEIPTLLNPRSSGGPDHLIVPVEPTLELRAKRLIASPEEFLPEGMKQSREILRLGGLHALRHFKSDANATLLQAILEDAGESVAMHARCFEVLLHWDVDVRLPESAQEITKLYLPGTNVTDKGLKQVAALKKLTVLDLRGTKVTAAGLKELAGLGKLETIRLSENDLSDAYLQVLCETGLMHTLESIGGKPETDDGIITLKLSSNLVTDAGLSDLAGLRNLARLDLRGTRVTDAGIAELHKALPNCEIQWQEK